MTRAMERDRRPVSMPSLCVHIIYLCLSHVCVRILYVHMRSPLCVHTCVGNIYVFLQCVSTIPVCPYLFVRTVLDIPGDLDAQSDWVDLADRQAALLSKFLLVSL